MPTFAPSVPAKLQLDGWWLDHPTRPFPKQVVAAKLAKTKDAP